MSQSILIVEDHELIQLGLKLFLTDGNSNDYEVIGTVSDGLEAINFCQNNHVDLIIMDAYMPNLNGIEATKIILSQNPDQKILVISIDNSIWLVRKLFEFGVSGYINKDANKEEFLSAVKSVIETGYYLSEKKSKEFKDYFLENGEKDQLQNDFSERELEVIKLICNETTTEDIADTLLETRGNIEMLKKNILTKIKAKSVSGMVLYAIQNGLYEVNSSDHFQ